VREPASHRAPLRAGCISLIGLFLTVAWAQETERLPLNSERIEARFGSYGIEVLHSDASMRVSSLYSGRDEHRVTRTFAVVAYPDVVDDAFTSEHADIVAGGSIGAVFAAAGWRVIKHNWLFTHLSAGGRVARLMRVEEGTELAVHVYVLEVENGDTRAEYAAIAEVHHPDYLSAPQLIAIYGGARPLTEGERARARALLRETRRQLSDGGPENSRDAGALESTPENPVREPRAFVDRSVAGTSRLGSLEIARA
jgi:hypothetical protein